MVSGDGDTSPAERRTYFEELLEVGAAGRQDHLVGLQALSLARQCHVYEILIVSQRLELRRYVRLEIVPSQTELLVATQFCSFHYLYT